MLAPKPLFHPEPITGSLQQVSFWKPTTKAVVKNWCVMWERQWSESKNAGAQGCKKDEGRA